MTLHEGNYYPLTTAQRGLWFSQKITPGAIMNIAEAVEICGAIKPEIFQQALHQVVAEAEQLRVRVVEQDAKPRQIVRSVYEGDFPVHRYEPRSRSAGRNRSVDDGGSDAADRSGQRPAVGLCPVKGRGRSSTFGITGLITSRVTAMAAA